MSGKMCAWLASSVSPTANSTVGLRHVTQVVRMASCSATTPLTAAEFSDGYCGQVALGSKLRSGITDACGIIGRI